MKKVLFLLLALSLGTVSCTKDKSASAQLDVDKMAIEDYLAEHNLTAQSTASGLYYIIDNQGTGAQPILSSTVTVKYTGWLLDGTKVDGGTITYPLNVLIKGWQEGIPLFNEGGNGTLFIPSCLAYGITGAGDNIPPNAVLIFDINLISVE